MSGNDKDIINEKDAQIGFAMNWEDKITVQPNIYATPEKCKGDEGLCSTIAPDDPGNRVGESYSRK